MSTEIVMPQMGESIAEGTITKWLKKVGERVERDEPLFEISTDKVDAEIPSPAAGTLTEVRFKEGETVDVNTVVAVLDGDAASGNGAAAKPPVEETRPEQTEAGVVATPPAPAPQPKAESTEPPPQRQQPTAPPPPVEVKPILSPTVESRHEKEDDSESGSSGAVAERKAPAAAPPSASPALEPAAVTVKPMAGDRVEQMSVMRKKIAEHMVLSRRTSAHVTTVYEIDMTRIAKLRDEHRDSFYQRTGTKLTYMPFIFQAVNNALRKFPIFNAQVSGDQIIFKQDINLGMAVALDWGLIVPVIKRADDLSISGLARAANDLAERARTKQLKPDEVAGGTFTITNPGVFGGLFGTPIINQPQLAILGVGKIEKRAKVLTTAEGDDFVGVRWMAYFALSFDHRVIDGADAERFLAYIKEQLEAGDFPL